MKTIVFAVALLVTCGFVAAQKNSREEDTTAVLKICREWDDAYMKKDPAPLDRLLPPDYVGIDEEGSVTSKQDEINLIKTGEYVILSVEHLEPAKVRFYGPTAIVTTHSKVKQLSKGKVATLTGRATTVCVKENSAWKIASWHASKAAE
jgi:ketosteroid isomerase-like protein